MENFDENKETIITVGPTGRKVNFLNNKDLLKEIHKSKNSYSEFIDKKYHDYDIIIETLDQMFLSETIENAKINRANRIATNNFDLAITTFFNQTNLKIKPKLAEFKIDPSTISQDELVFRLLTYEHIPEAPGRKKNPKSESDKYVKLNFHPYKHYIIENNEAKEVGRSHSANGKFSLTKGNITPKLANMFILLVNKYAQRSNWRSYTYLDEMKGMALLQLSQMGLLFDEYRSDNPFSYYTQSLQNSFTRVLNIEKKNQELRDELLIEAGASPSFSKQLALEDEIRRLREDAQDANKFE